MSEYLVYLLFMDARIHLCFCIFYLFYRRMDGMIYVLIHAALLSCQLSELQSKVRSDVSSEYWLRVHCAYPESQLFDWGMMRLHRPLYGVGDAFDMAADDNLKKKRDVKVICSLSLLMVFYFSDTINLEIMELIACGCYKSQERNLDFLCFFNFGFL